MAFRIIPTDDEASWSRACEATGAADVYFRAAYHRAYETEESRAYAFVAEVGGETLFFPFLLSPISTVGARTVDGDLADIETVYGYSGPMATSTDPAFLKAAWSGFGDWAREAGAVTSFIRFNPLYANQGFAHPRTVVREEQKTVLIPLEVTTDELLGSYTSNQRNRLRKAERHALVCRETTDAEGLEDFIRIYNKTMVAVGASDFYFFPKAYYESLLDNLGPSVRIFTTFSGDVPIASAMFFFSKPYVHYHLGGSLRRKLYAAPNNLLFHTVAVTGLREGYAGLHMGGGRTAAPDDRLLRFKRRFSKTTLQFRTGRHVLDAETYADLCRLWDDQFAAAVAKDFFQKYRLPVPNAENSAPESSTAL